MPFAKDSMGTACNSRVVDQAKYIALQELLIDTHEHEKLNSAFSSRLATNEIFLHNGPYWRMNASGGFPGEAGSIACSVQQGSSADGEKQ